MRAGGASSSACQGKRGLRDAGSRPSSARPGVGVRVGGREARNRGGGRKRARRAPGCAEARGAEKSAGQPRASTGLPREACSRRGARPRRAVGHPRPWRALPTRAFWSGHPIGRETNGNEARAHARARAVRAPLDAPPTPGPAPSPWLSPCPGPQDNEQPGCSRRARLSLLVPFSSFTFPNTTAASTSARILATASAAAASLTSVVVAVVVGRASAVAVILFFCARVRACLRFDACLCARVLSLDLSLGPARQRGKGSG